MQALHFGAGNIGKGFIGYLLNKTGYEICLVDVNQAAIDRFNKHNRYFVEMLDDHHTVEEVSPVKALNSLTQEQDVIDQIEQADIITTSVGVDNLSRIAGVLAKGLLKRVGSNKKTIDVIANENAINASSALQGEIEKVVSPEEMNSILAYTGFPNASIDRLALSKEGEEEETALVEPIFEWVINQKEAKNHELPPIYGATYVDDLKPFIERKLYSVNMGHAATAYIANLFNEPTIQSALDQPEIERMIQATMNETAQYFITQFNVSQDDMDAYIQKTLKRFKNKNISDDIYRVGRAPIRKLGHDERLVKPARELKRLGLPVTHLTCVIAAGYLFAHPEDEEAVRLQTYVQDHGIEKAVNHFSEIEDQELLTAIIHYYQDLERQKQRASKPELPV
ncbi:mannitol-1-phosphate 5-dehydrogenase [Salisediminibacterium beveridgei]|uniref:Mannitol-1-phosphate 5-dehydrogenase n=1 Tax=Salisediminibacterium beveridgei TaxID=632773 RepID=A0A1D7QX23_9BACI|nr:mannitol-1-phosphate 5-dehydrogenase [Salisediminibacterium beveridgei]AOM83555.1 Mannitol-1-phosphate 5-dehydrogenase [Salisediminibacterium beveridgei]